MAYPPIGARVLVKRRKHYWLIKTRTGGGYAGNWELEHRVVAAQGLGRQLSCREIVHHRNGDGLDNRPENLEVVSHTQHYQRHK